MVRQLWQIINTTIQKLYVEIEAYLKISELIKGQTPLVVIKTERTRNK